MNCARVTINGTSKSPSSWIKPGLYLANIYGDGTCNTVEGRNYVFPYPGDAVTYGGDVTANTKYSSSQLKGAACPAGADGAVSGYTQSSSNSGSSGNTAASSTSQAESSSTAVTETSPTTAPVASPTVIKKKTKKCRRKTKTITQAAISTY